MTIAPWPASGADLSPVYLSTHATGRWIERGLRGEPIDRLRRAHFVANVAGDGALYRHGAAEFIVRRDVRLTAGGYVVATVMDARDSARWRSESRALADASNDPRRHPRLAAQASSVLNQRAAARAKTKGRR